MSTHRAVAQRLISYFRSRSNPDDAARVMKLTPPPAPDLEDRLKAHDMAFDYLGQEAVSEALFLETGDTGFIQRCLKAGELANGLHGQVRHLIRLAMLDPRDQRWPLRLLLALVRSGQDSLAEIVIDRLMRIGGYEITVAIASAAVMNWRRAFDKSLHILDGILTAKLPTFLRREIAQLRGLALEGVGRYDEAASMFLLMNDLSEPDQDAPQRFRHEMLGLNSLPAVPMPEDQNKHFIFMLGFPRSGTTLLENVLTSHPAIDTIEEAPTLRAARAMAGQVLSGDMVWTTSTALKARVMYDEELARRVRKAGASIVIDKLPILSAQAGFLKGLFPQRKYVFSIRDPRDVVLSSFKQKFRKNTAMDNLVTFEKACELYDFTMSQWFSFFDLFDQRVCYVRYEKLVLEFDTEVRRVLQFLGLPWDDRVLDFSQTATSRADKTPSYQKVRQGLGIGVQSSWRNYAFLFERPEARLLDKWIVHFGYSQST